MSTQSSIGPIAELFQDPESGDPGYTDISEELVDEFVKLDVPAPPDEEQVALATTAHILGRGIRVRDDLDSHATGPAGYEGPAVRAPAQTAPGASGTRPTLNLTEVERQLPPVEKLSVDLSAREGIAIRVTTSIYHKVHFYSRVEGGGDWKARDCIDTRDHEATFVDREACPGVRTEYLCRGALSVESSGATVQATRKLPAPSINKASLEKGHLVVSFSFDEEQFDHCSKTHQLQFLVERSVERCDLWVQVQGSTTRKDGSHEFQGSIGECLGLVQVRVRAVVDKYPGPPSDPVAVETGKVMPKATTQPAESQSPALRDEKEHKFQLLNHLRKVEALATARVTRIEAAEALRIYGSKNPEAKEIVDVAIENLGTENVGQTLGHIFWKFTRKAFWGE